MKKPLKAELQYFLKKNPDDKIFWGHGYPCHYNAWRRYGLPNNEGRDEPLGRINGQPFRGT